MRTLRKQLLWIFLVTALVVATSPTIACKWGDDDEENGDDAADDDTDDDDFEPGDDTSGDDDGDDDDDSDDDSDDDADDDDTDPFADDRLLYVPAVVEPGGDRVAVLSEVWRDAGGAHLRLRLVSSETLSVVRSGPPIDLDDFGYGSVLVEDFDGDGVAEIVATLLYISATDASSRIVEIDPATLDEGGEIAFFDGEIATLAGLIDTDFDDVPELPVRLQNFETGRRRVAGYRREGGAWPIADLLTPSGFDDVSFALHGLPRRDAWARALPDAKAEGDLFIAVWGEDPPGHFYVFFSTLATLEITDPERHETRSLGAFDVSLTDRGPADVPGEYYAALAVERPDESTVEIRDDAGNAIQTFSYPPDTALRVSFAQDIDLDGAADLAVFANLPGDPYRLDIYKSSTDWKAKESFSGDNTSIRVIGALRPPGITTPDAVGGIDPAFGLVFEQAGALGRAQIYWYEAPFADFVVSTPQLQVATNHLNLSAYVFDFDGDGDDEVFTAANGYDTAPAVAYSHRLRVYDGDLETPDYDSGEQADTAYTQWPWDFDGDGAADLPVAFTTNSATPTSLRVITGANGWGDALFEFESEPQATVLLGGLLR